MMVGLVNGDKQLLDLRLGIRGRQMYHVILAALIQRAVIPLLAEIDEVVGINANSLNGNS